MIARASLIAVALAVLSLSARAQDPGAFDDSDWVVVDTTTVRETGGGFGEPERVRALEKLREKVLDQLCRNIKIPINYDLKLGEYAGIGAGLKRYIAQMPDGTLAIADEEALRVSVGHSFPLLNENGVGGALWLGGRVEGASMVVRPLGTRSTCKELDTLVDLRDIKTVLPVKGSRIAEMRLGELWRVPLKVTLGHHETVGMPSEDGLGASLTLTAEESGAATMTLYRLSESQLRVRYRVDRVEVRGKGIKGTYTFPAVQFASFGLGIVGEFAAKELTGELRKYLMLSMGWSTARNDGKRIVLEYIVDPRVPEHADAVAKALKGDFDDLVTAGYRLAAQKATDDSTRQYYLKLQEEHNAVIGPTSYAAMSEYEGKTKTFGFNLALFGGTWSKTRDKDRMTRLDGGLEQYMLNHAGKLNSTELFDLPFVGALNKRQHNVEVYSVTRAEPGQVHGEPLAVFIRNFGFYHATAPTVRESVEDYNGILSLAGALRPGTERRMQLPVDKFIIPPPTKTHLGRGETREQQSPSHKGLVSFTVVFTQKAVREILQAPAEIAAAAFTAVAKDLMGESALAKAVGEFLSQLAAIRATVDNEQRGAMLTHLIVGGGKLNLEYDDMVKVLIQLVDPLDLRGEFVANVNRPKEAGGNMNLRLALRKDRQEDKLLSSAASAKNRFATPSILLD